MTDCARALSLSETFKAFSDEAQSGMSTMTYTTEVLLPAALLNANPMMNLARQFSVAVGHSQAHSVQALMRVQIELLSFSKHRTQANVKLIDDLIVSEQYQNTFGVYGEFCKDMIAGYISEVGKISNFGSKVLSDAAMNSASEIDDVLDDMAASVLVP